MYEIGIGKSVLLEVVNEIGIGKSALVKMCMELVYINPH